MKLISFYDVSKILGEFSLLRKEAIKKSVCSVYLKFVITRVFTRGLDKDFKNIVVPGFAIVFDNIRKQIMIFHLGQVIKVVAIPKKLSLGFGAGGPVFFLKPRKMKIVDRNGFVPASIVWFAIDDGGVIGPFAGVRAWFIFRLRC